MLTVTCHFCPIPSYGILIERTNVLKNMDKLVVMRYDVMATLEFKLGDNL